MLRAIAIDDDDMALLVVSKLCRLSPYVAMVNTYSDSVKGAAGIILDHPDLIFLDMEMPDFNGIQIMSALKRPPKIIVVSANPDFRNRALELNAVEFITKPLDTTTFNSAVKKVQELLKSEHELA